MIRVINIHGWRWGGGWTWVLISILPYASVHSSEAAGGCCFRFSLFCFEGSLTPAFPPSLRSPSRQLSESLPPLPELEGSRVSGRLETCNYWGALGSVWSRGGKGGGRHVYVSPKTELHLRHPRLPPSLVKNVLVFLRKVESKPVIPTPQPWGC